MLEEVNFTLVNRRVNPYVQVGIALAVGWAGMLICKIANIPNAAEYFAALIAIVFFCLLNTVVSLAHPSFFRYTVPSYYMFIFLLAVLLLSARYTSGTSIWDLEIYRMMLVPIVLFYAIASLLVRGLRMLYEAAQNE